MTNKNVNIAGFLIIFVISTTACNLNFSSDLNRDDRNNDSAYCIKRTLEGGFILAGYSEESNIPQTEYHGCGDFYVIKTDANYHLLWQKLYGGSYDDYALSVQVTDDGGFIIVGNTYSTDFNDMINHGYYDIAVLRLDADGNIVWNRMFGGSDLEWACSVEKTNDNGFIIAGYTRSEDIPGLTNVGIKDVYVIKINGDGDLEWQKTYGGEDEDIAQCIIQTKDGGYMIAGSSRSDSLPDCFIDGESDMYFIKITSNGELEWQKTYGGELFDSANSVVQTSDNGFIVAGYSNSYDILGKNQQDYDFLVLKLSSTGTVEWKKGYGNDGTLCDEYAESIIETSDHGYVIAGHEYSIFAAQNKYEECYLVKINSTGQLRWKNNYGTANDDQAFSVAEAQNGDLVVAGFINTVCLSQWKGTTYYTDALLLTVSPGGYQQKVVLFPNL